MKKVLLIMTFLLFIIFLIIYFSSSSNYYEVSNYKKVKFTNEQIKEFEKDVESGKNVNINDYVSDESKDYSNNITKVGDYISNNIFDISSKAINLSYNFISKVIGF